MAVDHQTSTRYKSPSQQKSTSIDNFFQHNYPQTPPLSLSSRSLSGSSSPPRLSAPCAFLEPPTHAAASAPMYYFTGATIDSSAHQNLQPMIESSESQGFVSSPAAKRRRTRADSQRPLPNHCMQVRQPNSLISPEQGPGTLSNPSHSIARIINQQPSSFCTTMMKPIGFEHHHYIAPSSATYPLPQDRYNCPDCGRAFSRPSSLKIHTYSHTGEKPFYCPVRGCNKSFSVRSNMKRHERGCHGKNR